MNYENAIVIADFLEADGCEKKEKPGVISDEYYLLSLSRAICCELSLTTNYSTWLTGRPKPPLAKVFSSMKKRETSFKAELWNSIQSLLVCLFIKRGPSKGIHVLALFS